MANDETIPIGKIIVPLDLATRINLDMDDDRFHVVNDVTYHESCIFEKNLYGLLRLKQGFDFDKAFIEQHDLIELVWVTTEVKIVENKNGNS